MIEQITTIQDIVDLAKSGFTDWKQFGCVATRSLDDLLIFNYTTEAQYKGEWNLFECVSRGLIIDRVTGEIVARPFDKFFNWGEGGRVSAAPMSTVTAKMDGSLGILFRHNGKYRIATRGSFDSVQALWATRHWNECYADVDVPDELTLLFEIIYPENRVVVDYKGKSGLHLIGARNRFTGSHVPYLGLMILNYTGEYLITPMYRFDDMESMQAQLATMTNAEGFVAEFEDGQRFKFKTAEYLRLHKSIFSLSFKNTLEAMRDSVLPEYLEGIPDEFLGDVKKWVAHIDTEVGRVRDDVRCAFYDAPKESRKDFALWVQANYPRLKPYLFAVLDGKDCTPIIYAKHEFTWVV